MTREEKRIGTMHHIANTVADLMHTVNNYTANIVICYSNPSEEELSELGEWTRRYHGLFPGLEYFMIWEKQPDHQKEHLLYAVNVTGDSYLTATQELMDLVAAKF